MLENQRCFVCSIMQKLSGQVSHTQCLPPTVCTKEKEIQKFLNDNPKFGEWLLTLN